MTPIVHVDQQRAKEAWVAMKGISDAEDFAKTCKKTASRILASGLLPSLAFLKAKENDEQNGNVLNALNARLLPLIPNAANPNPGDVLVKMTTAGDAITLRRLTGEALAYLSWLARFADGIKSSPPAQE